METEHSHSWWALPGETPLASSLSDSSSSNPGDSSPRLTLEVLQTMLDPYHLSSFSSSSLSPPTSPPVTSPSSHSPLSSSQSSPSLRPSAVLSPTAASAPLSLSESPNSSPLSNSGSFSFSQAYRRSLSLFDFEKTSNSPPNSSGIPPVAAATHRERSWYWLIFFYRNIMRILVVNFYL